MIPLRDSIRPRRRPFVNWLLILINLWVFFFKELGLSQAQLSELFYNLGVIPARVTHALQTGAPLEPLLIPFITAMFLHGGWVHLGGNMLYLWIFGDNVEDRLGHFRFLLFYLLCGVVGSLAHVLANPASPVPVIGASGAIAGVLGGYFVTFRHSRILALVPVFFFLTLMEVPAVIFLALWFVIQLFNGAASLGGVVNPVAWWAHVGGFIAGMILMKLLTPRSRIRNDYPWW
ncbi:rhomboid family intramembrane serine protease [Desulfofundulus salinus]|uniref:Rhomboid family intramembrane serine protease n=1 Tax=Desulfofundulus salinus TaxID=2419843 RepID=A0A494WXE7_9FIRM|nr:rhomboid family intramembrane serine protease [Desulfofundulus salinum]RKO67643.1 rhomboid family intramembrane serine protease [Desulfofundulus salinum]